MFKKNYILIITSVIVFFYIINSKIMEEILKVRILSTFELVFLLIVLLIMYFLSGIEWKIIIFNIYKIRIKTLDLLTIPITSNFFSLIIPFQGSTLYTMYIFKIKYAIKYLATIGLTIISATINVVLFIVSFLIIIYQENLNYEFNVKYLILIFILTFLILNSKLRNVLLKYARLIFDGINQISLMLIIKLIGINLINICVSSIFYYYVSFYLGYSFNVISILYLVMISRVSIYLKLTPGGVGIQEVITNALFIALSMDGAQAASVVFYGRAISLIPMFILGPLDLIFRTKSISEIKRFKN